MKIWVGLLCLTMAMMSSATAIAGGLSPNDLKRIGYDQHIGQPISAGLTLQESDNRTVALGDLFNTKPTLLVLGYYHCPMLCTLINDGLIQALHELPLSVGEAFDIVDLSIDPREAPALAISKKIEYVKAYGRPGADADWHFLVGNETT